MIFAKISFANLGRIESVAVSEKLLELKLGKNSFIVRNTSEHKNIG